MRITDKSDSPQRVIRDVFNNYSLVWYRIAVIPEALFEVEVVVELLFM